MSPTMLLSAQFIHIARRRRPWFGWPGALRVAERLAFGCFDAAVVADERPFQTLSVPVLIFCA